jgi:hypothetical protein
MVRINSTVHLVSSYDISWFIERNRKQGSATISRFFRPDDPNIILLVTGAIIHAYNDAKSRLELDGKPWLDPFRQNAPDEATSSGDAPGDDEAVPGDVNGPGNFSEPEDHLGRSRKRRRSDGDQGGTGKKKKVNHHAMDHALVCASFSSTFSREG